MDGVFGFSKNGEEFGGFSFANVSGTIKQKKELCAFTVNNVDGEDPLQSSESLKALIEQLYNFIKESA